MQEAEVVKLISVIMQERGYKEKKEYQEAYDNLLSYFKDTVIPAFEKLSLSGKTEFANSYLAALANIELFANIPILVGKKIIAVFTGKEKSDITDLLTNNPSNYLKYNNSIINIIASGDQEEINAVNKIGSLIRLTKKEYFSANKLYVHNIDVRDLVNYYLMTVNYPLQNVVFIHIPYYARKDENYKKLLALANGAILCSPTIDIGKLPKELQNNCVAYYNDTDNYSIKNQTDRILFDEIGLLKWLYKQNQGCFNFAYCWQIKLLFSDIYNTVKNRIAKENKLLNTITSDIVRTEEDEEFVSVLKQYKAEHIAKRNELTAICRQLNNVFVELCDVLEALETCLCKELNFKSLASISEQSLFIILKTYNSFLALDEKKECEKLYKLLDALPDKYSYLLNLTVRKKNPSLKEIRRLKAEPINNSFIKHLKIRFSKQIGLSDKERIDLVTSLNDISQLSVEELSFAGDYYSQIDVDKAIKYYLEGAKRGEPIFSKKLLEIDSFANDNYCIKQLAETFDPMGAYLYARQLMNNKKIYEGQLWMRIAASLDNLEAIAYLANFYFKRSIENNKYQMQDYAFNSRISLGLYQYLESKEFDLDEVMYRIGILHYQSGDYRRAYKYFAKSSKADAYYKRGRMKAGLDKADFEVNLKKAKELLEQAQALGHSRARVDLEKVKKQINIKNQVTHQQEQDNTTSYKPTVSTEKCSGSCCFVMAATCISLGILSPGAEASNFDKAFSTNIRSRITLDTDKNNTLRTLLLYHRYRDKSLLQGINGNNLLKEYYRLSKALIQKINASPAAMEIYKYSYNEQIKPILSSIATYNYESADKQTIMMMINMCRKYDIPVDQGLLKFVYSSRNLK